MIKKFGCFVFLILFLEEEDYVPGMILKNCKNYLFEKVLILFDRLYLICFQFPWKALIRKYFIRTKINKFLCYLNKTIQSQNPTLHSHHLNHPLSSSQSLHWLLLQLIWPSPKALHCCPTFKISLLARWQS